MGPFVGLYVGASVGVSVVGIGVGTKVGLNVGPLVGINVGPLVGYSVGENVGAVVKVGATVSVGGPDAAIFMLLIRKIARANKVREVMTAACDMIYIYIVI